MVEAILSSGLTALVVGGMVTYLGAVWSGRIIEGIKAVHSKELSALNSTLEIAVAQQIRNSDAQFNLYSEVWSNLQDLRFAGDHLWERASQEHLRMFILSLQNAKTALNRGRLILREDHFQILASLLEQFQQYEIGKARLIDLMRSDGAMQELLSGLQEDSIRSQIRQNRSSKEQYEMALEDVVKEFRMQLGFIA